VELGMLLEMAEEQADLAAVEKEQVLTDQRELQGQTDLAAAEEDLEHQVNHLQ
jgi:hypothetical protein